MNGQIKFIGTNDVTNFLMNKFDKDGEIEYERGLHKIKFLREDYLFDMKKASISENRIVMWGWLSGKKFAGQVAIEFCPKIP